ncbi:hypothetical protein AX14_003777 [Amanita brunnescens Koide BX004]|nr:hypothetical protein AX14_003777 [Amanita brunnescens Koide BX004]
MEEVKETTTAQTSAQLPLQDKPATESVPQAPMPLSDTSSNIREKGTGRKLIKMFIRSDAEDFESNDEEDEGPAKPIKFIGLPTKYRLDRAPYHRMMIHGHICIEEPTHWDVNIKVLFNKWDKSVKRYIWNSGFPSQMVKEASKVPFDQRSDAQCWVILEATREGYLPLGDAQAELDVELLALRNDFYKAVRCNTDNLLSVKDITTWLLLKMAEPEEWEVADWFWWQSCQMFSQWEIYPNALNDLSLQVDDHLVPKWFIIHGEPSQADLIRHFAHCGVQATDASSHL